LATFAIFGFLLGRYGKKKRDGEIFLLYMGLYAVARFFLEFLRGDADRGFVFNHLLSTSQFIAILSLVAVVVLAIYLRRQPAVVVSAASGPELRDTVASEVTAPVAAKVRPTALPGTSKRSQR
jgi:prolipoprotein diacylglyceryltransferase